MNRFMQKEIKRT